MVKYILTTTLELMILDTKISTFTIYVFMFYDYISIPQNSIKRTQKYKRNYITLTLKDKGDKNHDIYILQVRTTYDICNGYAFKIE